MAIDVRGSGDSARPEEYASGSPSGLPDVAYLWRCLRAERWVVLGCTAGFAALLVMAAFLMRPVYRVSSILAPAGDSTSTSSVMSSLGDLGPLASLAGLSLGRANDPTEESLAVMRSREFLEVFITRHGLMPVLYSDIWNSQTRTWATGGKPPPTLAKGAQLFKSKVRIEIDRKVRLVTLSVDWGNPAEAESWCAALIDDLNAEMRRRALKSSESYLGFLERELQISSTVETRQAISRLIEMQMQRKMIATITGEYAFRVVDRGLAPDPDDFVRPRRKLMLALGLMLGLGVGMTLAFFRQAWRKHATSP